MIRDPLDMVRSELSVLRQNVSSLLGSGHPALDTIAKYYFQAEGKHVRPLIVLLIARATNGLSPRWPELVRGNGYLDSYASAAGPNGPAASGSGGSGSEIDVDEPLSPREVLNDFNPHMESIEGQDGTSSSTSSTSWYQKKPTSQQQQQQQQQQDLLSQGASALSQVASIGGSLILPTQRRLAEITEMIHVASLLHDDVIDDSPQRRGAASAPAAFGNKLSILGGDFLLGRASVALARLRNNEVVELVATVIANLVEGEVMQLRAQALQQQQEQAAAAQRPRRSMFTTFWQGVTGTSSSATEEKDTAAAATGTSNGPSPEMFEHYLQKTYLKTAALIGKAARAAAILGGHGAESTAHLSVEEQGAAKRVRDAAYHYGRNLGIAFQLVDDLLDFKATSAIFGKPSGGADLRLGLATAPVLYAWEQFPDSGLGEMVKRKFSAEGDVEKVRWRRSLPCQLSTCLETGADAHTLLTRMHRRSHSSTSPTACSAPPSWRSCTQRWPPTPCSSSRRPRRATRSSSSTTTLSTGSAEALERMPPVYNHCTHTSTHDRSYTQGATIQSRHFCNKHAM